MFGKLASGDGLGRGRDGSLGKLNSATQEFGAGVVVVNQLFESEREAGHVAASAEIAMGRAMIFSTAGSPRW